MPNIEKAQIRSVTPDDLPQIANYLGNQMSLSSDTWASIMQHWWHSNPAFNEHIARGWLIENADGIMGFVGNIPTQFQIDQQILTSHNPTTWYVSESFRRTSLSRQLFHEFAKTADTSVSFITTPGAHVVRFYREDLRYQNFPKIARQYFYYIYDHAHFLGLDKSRKLKLQHVALLPFYKWRQKNQIKTPRALYQVKQLQQADQGFDALWQQAIAKHMVTHCRDSKTINWLLAGHKAADKYLFGCYAGDELIGYGLFMNKQDEGRRVLECLDLFSVNHNPRIYSAIVGHLIEINPSQNVAMLKIPTFNQKIKQACRSMNLPLHTLNHYYMLRYGNQLSREIETSEATYLSGIHGDYALF